MIIIGADIATIKARIEMAALRIKMCDNPEGHEQEYLRSWLDATKEVLVEATTLINTLKL